MCACVSRAYTRGHTKRVVEETRWTPRVALRFASAECRTALTVVKRSTKTSAEYAERGGSHTDAHTHTHTKADARKEAVRGGGRGAVRKTSGGRSHPTTALRPFPGRRPPAPPCITLSRTWNASPGDTHAHTRTHTATAAIAAHTRALPGQALHLSLSASHGDVRTSEPSPSRRAPPLPRIAAEFRTAVRPRLPDSVCAGGRGQAEGKRAFGARA